jgi:Lrp/AsnC family transcriptional regulator, leucine-responsive regulatory protein
MAYDAVMSRIRFVNTKENEVLTSRSSGLDEIDWRLLRELQADARLSYNELARRVHLSAPAVAERVRRLEQDGVIVGYCARVDPARAGHPLLAFVQLRCTLGHCLLRTASEDDYPEIAEIHKLSGEHCTLLKVRAASLAHLEGLVERLGQHGEMRTHIVLSTQFDRRVIEPPPPARPVTPAERWGTGR